MTVTKQCFQNIEENLENPRKTLEKHYFLPKQSYVHLQLIPTAACAPAAPEASIVSCKREGPKNHLKTTWNVVKPI